jgi:hypothetical protein
MSLTVEFASVPKFASARAVAANVNADGSGTIYPMLLASAVEYVAPAKGARVERITVINSQATLAAASANRFMVFIWDLNTAAWKLYDEKFQAAATRAVGVLGQKQIFSYFLTGGLNLMAGQKLGFAIQAYAGVADQTDCHAEILEYT